jgi:uncharacterized protein YbjQ (UPF0145 family)
MEQFAQDKSAFAFQKPFPPPANAPQGGGALRPFTAVDLAPPATSGKAPLGPAANPMGPAASPFLESFGGAFDKDSKAADAIKPDPMLEPRALAAFRVDEPPAAVEDFSPAMPMAPTMPMTPDVLAPIPAREDGPAPLPPMPVAARNSQILAAADMGSGSISSMKPRFFLTSTAVVDGYPIQAYLDVISVEIVLPKDLLFRNPAPYGELHRLKAAEDQLQKVKAKALEELTDKAKHLHADGVVGVAVTFTNLDTVCCLCSAVGTAVKIA